MDPLQRLTILSSCTAIDEGAGVARKFSLLIVFLCAFLVATPSVADETFSLKLGYAVIDPDGRFAGEDGGSGTEIDFDDDLGFDESDNIVAEGAFQLGRFRISAGYLPLEFSGNGTLTRDIVFNGRTFSASTNVVSDVEIELYDFGLAFHILDVDDGPMRLQLGPEVAVKIADVEMSIRETSGGNQESVDGVVPVPTIGGRARIGFGDYLGVVGRMGYLEIDDNSFLDADVQVEFSPVPLVGIFAGYRYIDVDVDESGVVLKSTFAGPYAGVFMRF